MKNEVYMWEFNSHLTKNLKVAALQIAHHKTQEKSFDFSQLRECQSFPFFNVVLGIEPRASHTLGTCSTTEIHCQPQSMSCHVAMARNAGYLKDYSEPEGEHSSFCITIGVNAGQKSPSPGLWEAWSFY